MRKTRNRHRRALTALAALLCLLLSACGTAAGPEPSAAPAIPKETDTEEITMKLFINETEVPVTWEQNDSVAALQAIAGGDGLTVSMSMYGGFEQVGSLGQRLPRSDRQTTTDAGDIVLYSGDQIVVFYGSNSWAYTRLGRVELSRAEMTDLLANGDVTLRITEG